VSDLVVATLAQLSPLPVRGGQLRRQGRTVRWVEAGSGPTAVICDAALGEPGTLAWAGVLPLIAPQARVLAYDRAGIGSSDPMSPLTLDAEVGDLGAVVQAAGDRPAVLVGHSWGGLLALLLALRRPELVAGLVLVDPADEVFLAALPPDELRKGVTLGETVLAQHAAGTLAATVRDTFGSFAENLTADQRLRTLILDAYVSCYTLRSQVAMVRDEHLLGIESLPVIRRARARGTLPDVPLVVLSATTGSPRDQRAAYTGFHSRLAQSVRKGRHVVLDDTSHAVNQERPAQIAEEISRVLAEITQ
jgi:pimeloyl-ACP methyl ester carboxylesterase